MDFQSGAIRPRVLIIEDEPSFAQAVSYYLEKEGFDTTVAHDGEEGLRKAQFLLPDVIVLDLLLPVKDGLEVCRDLRAAERHPAICHHHADRQGGGNRSDRRFFDGRRRLRDQAVQHEGLRAAGQGPAATAPSRGHRRDTVEHLGVRIDRTRHEVTVQRTRASS